MAELQATLFTAYKFSVAEEPVALVFPDLNYKHIQTELAKTATLKSLLAYDPVNPQAFLLESEYMRGQMDALRFLLTISDDKKSALQKHLEAQNRSQAQD